MNTDFENNTKKENSSEKPKNGIWKLWVFLVILFAWIIEAQIENNSPTHQTDVKNALINAKNITYEETINSCEKEGGNTRDCYILASDAAKIVDKKLTSIFIGK